LRDQDLRVDLKNETRADGLQSWEDDRKKKQSRRGIRRSIPKNKRARRGAQRTNWPINCAETGEMQSGRFQKTKGERTEIERERSK